MLSGCSKKEYAKEAQAFAEAPDDAPPANGAAEDDLEAVVAHVTPVGRRAHPRPRRAISGRPIVLRLT